MKPMILYGTRKVYYENYALDSFRERIYQEEKALKRDVWLDDKAEKKLKKKREKKKKQQKKKIT
jgi:hypothetical protein